MFYMFVRKKCFNTKRVFTFYSRFSTFIALRSIWILILKIDWFALVVAGVFGLIMTCEIYRCWIVLSHYDCVLRLLIEKCICMILMARWFFARLLFGSFGWLKYWLLVPYRCWILLLIMIVFWCYIYRCFVLINRHADFAIFFTQMIDLIRIQPYIV
jgi:hypothetical protein